MNSSSLETASPTHVATEGKKHQLSHLKQQLGCNYHMSLLVPLKSFYLLWDLHHSPLVTKKTRQSFVSPKRSFFQALTPISLTLTPGGVFAHPTSTVGQTAQRGEGLGLAARGKGQGAVTSSISAFSRDTCHSHLGKLLSRSHSAQTAGKKHRHKNCQALKGCSGHQTPSSWHSRNVHSKFAVHFE